MVIKHYNLKRLGKKHSRTVYQATSLLDARAYFEAIKPTRATELSIIQGKKRLIEKLEKYGSNYYGDITLVKLNDVLNGVTKFLKPQLIEDVESSIIDSLPNNVTSNLKKPKFKFNKNFGVFSFDRAAAGLYWIDELYCAKINSAVNVNDTYIDEETGKRYMNPSAVFPDGAPIGVNVGGSEVTTIEGKEWKYFPDVKVKQIGRKEARPDGTPFVRTNVEDVFIYFPKVNKQRPAVSLYFTAGGMARETAEQLLFSGVTAAVLSRLFQKIGIRTSINAVFGGIDDKAEELRSGLHPRKVRTSSASNWEYYVDVEVKSFTQTLDIDAVCIFADARFFRYESFNWQRLLFDEQGLVSGDGLGYDFDNPAMTLSAETDYFSENPERRDSTAIFVPKIRDTNAAKQFIADVINHPAFRVQL